MTDVLEHRTDILQTIGCLLSKQQILDLAKWATLAIVDKMIPSTRVTVQHGWCLENLPSIFFPTSLALESVMSITCGVVAVLEQLSQRIEREMSFDIFSGVNDTGRE